MRAYEREHFQAEQMQVRGRVQGFLQERPNGSEHALRGNNRLRVSVQDLEQKYEGPFSWVITYLLRQQGDRIEGIAVELQIEVLHFGNFRDFQVVNNVVIL